MALLSLDPSSLWAQVPPSFETLPVVVTEEEVRKFLDDYTVQYMKKDIYAFMAFFSKEAIENRMYPYLDIHEIYRRTFESSDTIQYRLEIYSIQAEAQHAGVMGRYEITQALKGLAGNRVLKGNIQWYLVREDGSLRIREINYGRDR